MVIVSHWAQNSFCIELLFWGLRDWKSVHDICGKHTSQDNNELQTVATWAKPLLFKDFSENGAFSYVCAHLSNCFCYQPRSDSVCWLLKWNQMSFNTKIRYKLWRWVKVYLSIAVGAQKRKKKGTSCCSNSI